MTARAAGLLLHPTSLPGPYGIGDLGPAAREFLRWARSAGQRIWQVLPLNPAGPHGSPYGGLSAFAGNPLLISPEELAAEGLLPEREAAEIPQTSSDRVDFGRVSRQKEEILRRSWRHFLTAAAPSLRAELQEFRLGPRKDVWLADWAVYQALRERFRRPWWEWDRSLARRDAAALASARRELAAEVEYHEYVQFLFRRQWQRVREEARAAGIAILGDLPIYIAHDSADVWAHSDIFALDALGRPTAVAGVPPDYFSPTGQLWGYPLYRWDLLEERSFDWWIERIRAAFDLADAVRIDHFRGFAGYWAVPAGEATALNGRWMPAPGRALFRAIRDALGELDIVAEDLGTITPDVHELARAFGIPGMKVLQFAFSEDDSPHLPHNHVAGCVVYTGTHDNDTARGWFAGLPEEDRRRVADYLGGSGEQIEWDLIRAAYGSVALRAIVPIQDVFELDGTARMNTPGRSEGNWSWRARGEDFTPERAARLERLARLTGRL